jgi:hypothetical protein
MGRGDRTDLSPFRRVVAPTGGAHPSFLRVVSALYEDINWSATAPKRETRAGRPIGHGSPKWGQCDEWKESTDLALQAAGLGDIVCIDQSRASPKLDLVCGRRRRGLEGVGVVVVVGASVIRRDGRVVEGIRRGRCDRYVGVRSAGAGVVELDVAARCAVVGGVVGVVALQILADKKCK